MSETLVAKSKEFELPASVFKQPPAIEAITMKWVKYAQEDRDPNDIAYAVHAAVAEVIPFANKAHNAVIQYCVENPTEDIHQLLIYWNEGNWGAIRRNWPDVPADIYPPGV